ncbi:MAG: NfeD family protein [Clostridia bacterium]|nr:NfeD family protein [Clostridia bacterium]
MWIVIWAVVFAVMLIVEVATSGLVSVWFCAGSLVALVLAIFDVPVLWQCVAFTAVSIIALILTRPLAKKFLKKKKTPTNSDRIIGKRGLVCETINNLSGTGSIKVEGLVWSARNVVGTVIPEGTYVTVESIEGVKAVVKLCEETDPPGEPEGEDLS